MAPPSEAQPRRFPYVQALRALAAASVAFDHAGHDLLATAHPDRLLALAWNAMPWKAGVDVFFVVSGFVIVHATRPLFGTASGPARFLFRRLARIVPLYWAATILFLASLALVPGAIHGAIPAGARGAAYLARSFLFIPARRPDGLVEPAFGLGWTLDFEMLFYAVMTPLVAVRRDAAVLAATLALALLVGAGRLGLLHGVALTTWADPIVFEFCAGMGLALLVARGAALPRPVRLLLAAVGLVALAVVPEGVPRLLAWGAPATLLVAAATLGRATGDAVRSRLEHRLERLGDASYALYLCHPFVMRPASLLWRHLGRNAGWLALPWAILVVAVSAVVALAIHRRFERPVTRALRRLEPGARART